MLRHARGPVRTPHQHFFCCRGRPPPHHQAGRGRQQGVHCTALPFFFAVLCCDVNVLCGVVWCGAVWRLCPTRSTPGAASRPGLLAVRPRPLASGGCTGPWRIRSPCPRVGMRPVPPGALRGRRTMCVPASLLVTPARALRPVAGRRSLSRFWLLGEGAGPRDRRCAPPCGARGSGAVGVGEAGAVGGAVAKARAATVEL
jgi:hypothetical protein